MITPFNLEGVAIRLTPLKIDHIQELCGIGLEPSLWRSTTIEVRSVVDMESYVRSALDAHRSGTALPFVIVDRVTGKVIGTTRFHSIVPEHKRLEIGFTWLALARQRTGVNTEAKYLMLRHAFEVMKFIRVEFRADADNEQSRRALDNIGAREEGVLRSYRISGHRGIRDLAVYSIIESEWPTVRATLEGKLKAKPNSSDTNDSPAYPDLAGARSAGQVRDHQPNMKLAWREASDADLGLLAEWNHQLIRDEGHRNSMTVEQLAVRMKNWLKNEYRAVIFSEDQPVGYALFKREEDLIYLRQFFVRPARRRSGIGRAALEILRKEIWPSGARLTVDVLCHNAGGVAFWRSVGYQDYCLTLEIMPR